MWADGWVISEERTSPGKLGYGSTGSAEALVELIRLSVLSLFNRTQPQELSPREVHSAVLVSGLQSLLSSKHLMHRTWTIVSRRPIPQELR